MSYNSKQLKVQSSAKKLLKPKDVDYISKMGYRDDSPFRDNPYNDIYTPNGIIDMSQTGIPLFAASMTSCITGAKREIAPQRK